MRDTPGWWSTILEHGSEKTKRAREFLFAGEVDEATRRRRSLFSNTLVLPGFNIYEALKIEDREKIAWKEHLIDLRAHHLEQAVFSGADLTKADLYGARLRGALLDHAQLHQGASLKEAQLQGASLSGEQLQGASLANAQLQGASLDGAQLQGALLVGAKLQGASLEVAEVRATDFTQAYLWRTQVGVDPRYLAAVRLYDPVWKPEDDATKAYAELRDSINIIPEGKRRNEAFKRIEILDCANSNERLASCDPAAEPPAEVLDWQNKLARASVDAEDYAKALATEFQSLVCANDPNAI
jgi:Pentapeptide repeats (8 copies)